MKSLHWILIGQMACSPWAAAAPQAPAPTPPAGAEKAGQLEDVDVVGEYKGKLKVGKFDPPAAFNLEDIQNFPEDRLQPVLSNPIVFEEGRDFAALMTEVDDRLYHPWLPEISRAPFLTMIPRIDQSAKDWTFAVIDQSGATVAQEDGSGNPPSKLVWKGEDKLRGRVAVDTVYIPQVIITNKDGYRRTYQGQPVEFATLLYVDRGKTVVEVSSKRLFADKKADFSQEAMVYLNKVCDTIRENNFIPFAIQVYEPQANLVSAREQAIVKTLGEKLHLPSSDISVLPAASPEKRGAIVAIIANGAPGGSGS